MWKKADALIAVSSNIVDELRDLYKVPQERIYTVHNGVDVDFFRKSNPIKKKNARRKLGVQGEPLILYVGHLSPRKGIEHLLKSIPKVVEKFPKAVFVLVGGTPKFVGETDYKKIWTELSAKLSIQNNVIFAGEVRHGDIPLFYEAAEFFVFPTLYEGLAKALLEAMACNLPVVATNAGGNPDAIMHGENGILVRPSDSDELADALIHVISDEAYAKEIGQKARVTVERNFTWKIAADRVMVIYDELLQG
jgi:glycosyltransferase involved in cell wall biosynthesis